MIAGSDFLGLWQQGKSFDDFPHLAQSAGPMLDDLSWWTRVLKAARQREDTVNDARALLVALCAVESVRAESESARLDVTRQNERRGNGVFEANNYRFSQRT